MGLLIIMKKLFYFLAIGAMALGLASCGGEENDPNLKNYKVKVLSTTENSIEVEITAVDKEKYFMCSIAKSQDFLKNPKERAQNTMTAAAVILSLSDPNFKYPDGLTKGSAKPTFDKLDSNTEYAVYIAEIDEEYKVVGDVEYKLIKTAGGQEQGENGGENGGGNGGGNDDEYHGGSNLAAPQNVKIIGGVDGYGDFNDSDITLSWDPVSGAKSYKIYRYDQYPHGDDAHIAWTCGWFTTIANVTETTYSEYHNPFNVSGRGAEEGAAIHYCITAIDANGKESERSEFASVGMGNPMVGGI